MSTIDSGHCEARYGAKKGSKKRFWSDEEKISICGQTRAPDVSVAQVARRYAMNANLIHKWLRDPRFGSDEAVQIQLAVSREQVASPWNERRGATFVLHTAG